MAKKYSPSTFRLATHLQFIRMIFSHLKIPSPIFPKKSKTLLDSFQDVFPQDLPAGLPSARRHDFKIALVPHAAPQKRGLYTLRERAERAPSPNFGTSQKKDSFVEAPPFGGPLSFLYPRKMAVSECV